MLQGSPRIALRSSGLRLLAVSSPARRVQAQEVRYLDIHENHELDKAQLAA
jgi:hypothetical protein